MKTLLRTIRENNILLKLVDGDLRIFSGNQHPDPALLAEIRAGKDKLIAFLQQNGQAGFTEAFPVNIASVPVADSYALSSSQRRLWVLSQFKEGNVAYNTYNAYVFEGSLQLDALTRAFDQLIDRHEILRTVFREDGSGEVRQFIDDATAIKPALFYEDLTAEANSAMLVRQRIQQLFNTNFDLSAGPLLRAGIYLLTPGKWVFVYVMHHIISDGWSMGILMQELMALYNAARGNEAHSLPALRIQYKDYAAWQQEQLSGELLEEHRAYWLAQFASEVPVLALPGDKPRPAVKTYNGATAGRLLAVAPVRSLQALCQANGSTLFMGLLAALNALLYRYTRQHDIIIGSPIAGRDHADLENQIGLYLNTLALRVPFNGSNTFTQLLSQSRQTTLGAFDHQVFPFDALVDELNLVRDMSRSALFDVMLILQTTAGAHTQDNTRLEDIAVSRFDSSENATSKFDLTFIFSTAGDSLQLIIEYNKDLYGHHTVTTLAAHFEQLLAALVAQPERSIAQVPYLDAAESRQLLEDFNDTATACDQHITLQALFEARVAQHPTQVALLFDGGSFTYRQLNEKANQLAHYLREEHGIAANDRVAIQLPRNGHLLVALLGVLKAGGAYVPIDPAYPQARISYMLEDSQCKVVLDETLLESLSLDAYNTSDPGIVNTTTDLAYVIYTSGSTGQPKGVMVMHRNVAAFLGNFEAPFGLQAGMVFGSVTNFTFDISVLELLGTLIKGLTLHLIADNEPAAILGLVRSGEIDALQLTPSRLSQLLEVAPEGIEVLGALKVLLVGGEALKQYQYEQLRTLTGTRCINVYGPTETTIWSSALHLQASAALSIGTPLKNERIYICDEQLALCPAGVVGEICISGDGVARGYLNKPALTADRFVNDPFTAGATMYRTGDLGRWLPDGQIQFLGRADDQVKLRGYRIELEEIQNVLLRYPGIHDAVLQVQDDASGDAALLAWLVAADTLDLAGLRTFISGSLPHYMLPDHYVILPALPLNASGKVDRKRLSATGITLPVHHVEKVEARNDAEATLLTIWENVLGITNIGVHDNFFAIGGHSLKATRLASKIHQQFNVQVGLKDLFSAVTPAMQAELIQALQQTAYRAVPAIAQRSYYPLSPSQYRLWIISQFEASNIAYNIQRAYVFTGTLDNDALAYAFNTLWQRHESLRTIFKEDEQGEIKQFILPASRPFQIRYQDLRAVDAHGDAVKMAVQVDFITPFDLSEGPMVRAGLIQLANDKWIFTYVMHHIISDGWSMGVLLDELLVFYNAYTQGTAHALSPLRIHYKDYAAWLQEQLSGAALQQHKGYWLQQFNGDIPVLELPGGKVRPPVKTYNGAVINTFIPASVGVGIQALCQAQGATLFMGLLAVVNALCYRYTGQEDLVIGTPIAGREHVDLEDQIGFYVNTLALRTRFEGHNSFRELLDHVKQVALGAYEHQVYPFDKLVDDLQLRRDVSRNPLFDVQVIVQNAGTTRKGSTPGAARLQVSGYEGEKNPASVFDMVFNIMAAEDGLHVSIVYNTDVYTKNSVTQLAAHLEQLATAIVAQPDQSLYALDYLLPAEKAQLLEDFNQHHLSFEDATLNHHHPSFADATPLASGNGALRQNDLSAAGDTLVSMFAQRTAHMPNATAVVFDTHTLTYAQLDEQSDRLAAYLLREYQLQAGELVGVMADRSDKMVVALLAILKAGGVYVPIHPEYPAARKAFIINDTNIKVLLTQTAYIFDLDYCDKPIFAIDVQLDTLDGTAVFTPPPITTQQLAYVIYTSGSTGTPKGVMVSHGAAASSLQAQLDLFQVLPSDRCLQSCSLSFDVSLFEMLFILFAGASMYILDEQDKKDPDRAEQFINRHQLTVGIFPAAYLRLLTIERLQQLRIIISGGESAAVANVNDFTRHGDFFNAYGPTEVSFCSTAYKAAQGTSLDVGEVPLGRPIAGVEVYILDEHLHVLPPGVIGEIFIGGRNLANGYINNPDLTAEKFVTNPFRPGQKMYRSGDRGKWMPDGNIVFAGRKDNQVKVNGYRIELEEIEKVLRHQPGVRAAVVLSKADAYGELQLVAYLVADAPLETTALHAALGRQLPAYMLPAYFVELDEFPLTQNGKADLKKLPDPHGIAMAAGGYIAPVTDLQKGMAAIWARILDREQVGIRHSFFDLGGDSIKILRMTAMLRKELGLEVPIADIYKYATIESILEQVLQNKDAINEEHRQRQAGRAALRATFDALKIQVLESGKLEDPDNIEDIYPMSDIEKGMVYESLLNEKQYIYHDQMVQRKFFPAFDIARFRQAVRLMTARHSILRTSFNVNDFDTDLQIVHKTVAVPVHYKDLSGLPRNTQEKEVRQFMRAELENPFRFAKAPLWRLNVYNFGNDEIIFLFQTHHAIIDGWSDASFTTELHNLYVQLEATPALEPAPLQASYKDYVLQHFMDKQDEGIAQFWREELAGSNRMDLFTGEDQFRRFAYSLDRAYLQKLEQKATALKTTVKILSFSSYLYMLKLLHYHEEIVAGLVTNNRPDCEDGDKILGCFLNTIPFKMEVDESASCRELVSAVHEKVIALKAYDRLSVMQISQLHHKHQEPGNPFFDVIFNYVDFHTYQSIIDDKTAVDSAPLPAVKIGNFGRTNTFLDFNINVTGQRYTMGLKLTQQLKCGLTPEQLGGLYFKILNHITDHTDAALGAVSLLDDAEQMDLLARFNDTAIAYPADKNVALLFHEQALRTPHHIALVAGNNQLTYAELDETSGRFAAFLRQEKQLQPGDLAGIWLERDEWLLIAILGILKAGAAYVPFDREYPAERIEYMLADSRCKILLDAALLDAFRQSAKVSAGDLQLQTQPATNPAGDLPFLIQPSATAAYVMYTSGSTGTPKGVVVAHQSIVRLVKGANYVSLNERQTLLSTGAVSFDATTFEYWSMLLNGGTLVLCGKNDLLDEERLSGLITQHGVSIMWFTAGWLHQLIDKDIHLFSGLKAILAGGDRLSPAHINRLHAAYPELLITNGYGPTENTTFSLTYPVSAPLHDVPVGKPISNSTAYILRPGLQLCPVGVAGEIAVGGDGLAIGYLHNDALTAEKFIPHPFLPGARLYLTGDLGRWLPDGNIAFMGRKDGQLKVRGYRIEPGEIEAVLQQHPGVKAAAVIAITDATGEKELAAYITGERPLLAADLRAFLHKKLPVYMLPASFTQLDVLPLTINGKVDRRKLPAPDWNDETITDNYVAPRNETEEKLCSIWQELLGRATIGVEDNFFEAGGHSLKVMKLSAMVHREFNVKIKLEDVFARNTIAEMARYIAREQWARESKEGISIDLVTDQDFIL